MGGKRDADKHVRIALGFGLERQHSPNLYVSRVYWFVIEGRQRLLKYVTNSTSYGCKIG